MKTSKINTIQNNHFALKVWGLIMTIVLLAVIVGIATGHIPFKAN